MRGTGEKNKGLVSDGSGNSSGSLRGTEEMKEGRLTSEKKRWHPTIWTRAAGGRAERR